MVKPVKSVGGSLKKYAKKHIPLEEIRETVWEQVAHERARNRNMALFTFDEKLKKLYKS